jgi:serine/threonine protein kinase
MYDPFKADIWAFGILLYWLVLGYFPQDNESIRKKKPSSTFQLLFPKDMHPGIEYLITKMLQEDPNERVTADEILVDTWVQPKDFKNEISRLMRNMVK